MGKVMPGAKARRGEAKRGKAKRGKARRGEVMINTVGGTPPPTQKEREEKRGDSYRQLYYSRETPRIGAVLLLRVFRFF
jgi:hypothetical protein